MPMSLKNNPYTNVWFSLAQSTLFAVQIFAEIFTASLNTMPMQKGLISLLFAHQKLMIVKGS